jgi:hypothetical protein
MLEHRLVRQSWTCKMSIMVLNPETIELPCALSPPHLIQVMLAMSSTRPQSRHLLRYVDLSLIAAYD